MNEQITELQAEFIRTPATDIPRLAYLADLIEGLRMVEASLTSERLAS